MRRMIRWLVAAVTMTVVLLLVMAIPLLAQDSTGVGTTPITTDWRATISGAAIPIATVAGSFLVWLASHFFPKFNAISVNADGTPSKIGTLVKQLTVVVSCYLVLLILHAIGAQAPAVLTGAIGVAWATFVQGISSGLAGVGVFKLATTAPAK